MSGNGQYGFDTATLGWQGGGGPSLNRTVVAGFDTTDFYTGLIGLAPNAVNWTDFNNPEPSLMTLLNKEGYINSNSFAYTAGSYNSPKQTPASLVFGGYDTSRFTPNNLTIDRGPDITHDLLIGLQSITSISGSQSLLPEAIIAYIDSTIAELWLPVDACKRFEDVFGLTWDEADNIYLVNDSLHNSLTNLNPTFDFVLGSSTTSNEIINIRMSYSSFDLTASWPLISGTTNSSKYFPLRRADNATQYTLGRTFLQESYLIVDYDRSNFSVSQALFPDTNVQANIVSILPPNSASSSGGKAKGVTIPIVGAIIAVAINVSIAWLIYKFWWKKRNADTKSRRNDQWKDTELDGREKSRPNELLAGTKHPNEVLGDIQLRSELFCPPGKTYVCSSVFELSDKEGNWRSNHRSELACPEEVEVELEYPMAAARRLQRGGVHEMA